jgi:bifunctional non-homologous end joining protein LigD
VAGEYEKKRDFSRTPEPSLGPPVGGQGPLLFVVQKHSARRLHYDLRLEVGGVLKSWAVPNGPSPDPAVKRLAVMVEDHPLEYRSFEGVIPDGEYGAGQVIVWDEGTYSPDADGKLSFDDRKEAEERVEHGLKSGKLSLLLRGHRLKGSWTLVKMRQKGNNWLLIKHHDEFAKPDGDLLKEDSSVISGLSIDDLKAGKKPANLGPATMEPKDIPGALSAPMPETMAPMLATAAELPLAASGWLLEPKLDGYRTLAFVRRGRVKLLSRNGLDSSQRYPSLIADLSRQPAGEMVLDGEIVALDEKGRPCFQCLQQYLKKSQEAQTSHHPAPLVPVYYVFDILYLDGFDLKGVDHSRRRDLLKGVLKTGESVRFVESFEGDGNTVFKAAIATGMEGIVAKRMDSRYLPGRRSADWLKIKATSSDDFVIGGYSRGSGNRAASFGALLLGYHDEKGRLIYSGRVGTGFNDETLAELKNRMDAIKTGDYPFATRPPDSAAVTWLRPKMVAEVKFAEWTQESYLRAPVFLRLRDDKPPQQVRRVETVIIPTTADLPDAVADVLRQLENDRPGFILKVDGNRLILKNLDKELWPAEGGRRPLTKRDLLVYLARVSLLLLPHLNDRPLSLSRYPDGIHGEHFFQKHWDSPPAFVETVSLLSRHVKGHRPYHVCNNLATLLWLGQVADIELHTWFSRTSPQPDRLDLEGKEANVILDYPDFIVFDLDPYIYSGKEAAGAEPELNRPAFARTCQVARWLKDVLDSLSLESFVKTSGATGIHVYVPIVRRLEYESVRAFAHTISGYLEKKHPREVTLKWPVVERPGKVFVDYNQNARGKTLASVYSPRPTVAATVSIPFRWEELDEVYPTDFTILNTPQRLAKTGDIWADMLKARNDIKGLLESGDNK